MPAKPNATSGTCTATIGFEAKLWLTADKLHNNQSRTLAALRDTLLPKLLWGKFSVADVKTSR